MFTAEACLLFEEQQKCIVPCEWVAGKCMDPSAAAKLKTGDQSLCHACKESALCYSEPACLNGTMSTVAPFVQCHKAKGVCDSCFANSTCGGLNAMGVQAGGDMPAVIPRYDATWYDKLLVLLANFTNDNDDVFKASETYGNITTNTTRLVAGLNDLVVDDTFIPPGPLLDRVVLGTAELAIGNETYIAVREWVQPFNFSLDVDGSMMSFIVPVWVANLTDDDGYATLTVSSPEGPEAVLRKALFYTGGPHLYSYGICSYGLYSYGLIKGTVVHRGLPNARLVR